MSDQNSKEGSARLLRSSVYIHSYTSPIFPMAFYKHKLCVIKTSRKKIRLEKKEEENWVNLRYVHIYKPLS